MNGSPAPVKPTAPSASMRPRTFPGAYKPIEQVIEAQRDLVEVVARLKQVVCVNG